MSTLTAITSTTTSTTSSALRALQLLDIFREEQSTLGVSDIGRHAGLPTSTVHRLLSHLVEGKFVLKEGSRYRLSNRLFELGNRVEHSQTRGLKNIAAPYIGELFAVTKLTTHLAVLHGPEIMIVDKVVGLHGFATNTSIGSRHPSSCTALGKAILAFDTELGIRAEQTLPSLTRYSVTRYSELRNQLATTRNTKIAYNREEVRLGLMCLASPILKEGRAIASISVSGNASDMDTASLSESLVRVTELISRRLAQAGR